MSIDILYKKDLVLFNYEIIKYSYRMKLIQIYIY